MNGEQVRRRRSGGWQVRILGLRRDQRGRRHRRHAVGDESGTVAATVVGRSLKAVELVLNRRREARRSLARAGAAHGKDLLDHLGGVRLAAKDEANFAVRVAERVQADQVVVRRAVTAVCRRVPRGLGLSGGKSHAKKKRLQLKTVQVTRSPRSKASRKGLTDAGEVPGP